jgi:hypothetical protein
VATGCGFDVYKYTVNDVAIVGRLQIKILVTQGRDTAGWAGAVGHCKCNGMVKFDNHLVLTVTNLGDIADVMFAIPALLCDQVGVMFPWRQNDLYFDPETKNSSISPKLMNMSHTGAMWWLSTGSYSMTKILQQFILNSVNLLIKYLPLSKSLIALGGFTCLKYPFIMGRGK